MPAMPPGGGRGVGALRPGDHVT